MNSMKGARARVDMQNATIAKEQCRRGSLALRNIYTRDGEIAGECAKVESLERAE